MQFTLHRDFSEIAPQAWDAIATTGISDTPFSRHAYLAQWWKTRGGGEWPDGELLLVAAHENSRLVGIAPLFAAEHDGRSSLLFVGSIEISDYLDFIVQADDLAGFTTGLLDFLTSNAATNGRALDLYDIPDSSPTLEVLNREAEKRGWLHRQETFRPTPRITLPGDFETYLGGLDKKQRHEIRRKMRRAAEGTSPAEFRLLGGGDDLNEAIEELFELMTHDEGKREFLTGAMREQMRAVIHLAHNAGHLWMAFLTLNDTKVAAALNFDYRNKLWGYNSAVHRDFTSISPGWVLLGHQIKWACEHGRTEFDFMRGDEEYKYRFGAVNRHVMRIHVAPRQAAK